MNVIIDYSARKPARLSTGYLLGNFLDTGVLEHAASSTQVRDSMN